MAVSLRLKKVESLMKQEISSMILTKEIKDARIGFCTVLGVNVSSDLRHAKVYVSSMGTAKKCKSTLIGLNNAKGYVRSQLKNKLKLRNTPALIFIEDNRVDDLLNISKVIKRVHDEKPYSEQDNKENQEEQ
jgi:ribosome-binding factor A